eukprot:scaffold1010_cov334-Prasinococcus_capsulatus_cf.AAC.9
MGDRLDRPGSPPALPAWHRIIIASPRRAAPRPAEGRIAPRRWMMAGKGSSEASDLRTAPETRRASSSATGCSPPPGGCGGWSVAMLPTGRVRGWGGGQERRAAHGRGGRRVHVEDGERRGRRCDRRGASAEALPVLRPARGRAPARADSAAGRAAVRLAGRGRPQRAQQPGRGVPPPSTDHAGDERLDRRRRQSGGDGGARAEACAADRGGDNAVKQPAGGQQSLAGAGREACGSRATADKGRGG